MNVGPSMFAIVIEGPSKGTLVWVENFAHEWTKIRNLATWWVTVQERCMAQCIYAMGSCDPWQDHPAGSRLICADNALRPLADGFETGRLTETEKSVSC